VEMSKEISEMRMEMSKEISEMMLHLKDALPRILAEEMRKEYEYRDNIRKSQ
jgi:hypothetical protein